MSIGTCIHDAAVVNASRTGEWDDTLRAHAARCVECAETARVAAWMQDVSFELTRDRALPDPMYLWLKAEIGRRAREGGGSAMRRSGIAAGLGLAAAGAGLVSGLTAFPYIAAAVGVARNELSAVLAEASIVDLSVIGSGWLGITVMLFATYLLVIRPLR